MKIFLFKNQSKLHSFEPDGFIRVKINDEWKELGMAKTGMTPKGTPYYELEVDEDTLVDKLRDIDWKPLGEKSAQFVSQLEDKRQAERYPEHYQEAENMTTQEVEDLFNKI